MSSTMDQTYAANPAGTKTKKTKCCRCPACQGLECLERPRYFAGQLLTEAELNSEQAYVLAKNRLHNRYLHGWGVVCGLAVVCSNCEGWVRINEGYAIDPCGNDIIVCKARDFNLIEAIHKCIEARKRPQDECAPWQDPNANCVDDEEHWCVTISYRENEAKPTMPLRQDSSSACSCGGSGGCDCGGGCGCGGGKKSSTKSKSTTYGCNSCQPAKPAKPSRSPACEPTRILESYCIDVIPQPQSCIDAHRTREPLATSSTFNDRFSALPFQPSAAFLSSLLPQSVTANSLYRAVVANRPDGSLLDRVLGAWEEANDFVRDNMTPADFTSIMAMVQAELNSNSAATGFATGRTGATTSVVVNQSAGDLCCRFRKVLQQLYNTNPLNVRCNGFDCPPCQRTQTPNPTTGTFTFTYVAEREGTTATANLPPADADVEAMRCLIRAFIRYVLDAVCLIFLPPCPEAPCDDRIILACVTVRNGKIIHICNFDCRHYAGSFNTLMYWQSLFPVVDLFAQGLLALCCPPPPRPGLSVVVDPVPPRVNP